MSDQAVEPAGKPARRGRKPQVDPVQLVECALAEFSEKGFAGSRLDDVAARAGVSKGTLYLYFPSKEALFKAVVRHTLLPNLDRFEIMVQQHQGPVAPLLEKLVRAVIRVLTGTKAGLLPKMVVAEAGNFPDLAKFYVEEVVGRGLSMIGDVLLRGVESGEFAPVGPLTPMVMIAPCLLSAIWNHGLGVAAGRLLDPDAFADEILRVLLNGLLVRGTP